MTVITQPSIGGYAITPYFIVLCCSILGTILFSVLLARGFLKRDLKERQIIEKSVKRTSVNPAEDTKISAIDFGVVDKGKTECIFNEKEESGSSYCEEFVDKTEGFGIGIEGFDRNFSG